MWSRDRAVLIGCKRKRWPQRVESLEDICVTYTFFPSFESPQNFAPLLGCFTYKQPCIPLPLLDKMSTPLRGHHHFILMLPGVKAPWGGPASSSNSISPATTKECLLFASPVLTHCLITSHEELIICPSSGTSLIAQLVKNPPAMQEILVQFLGWEDLLEME